MSKEKNKDEKSMAPKKNGLFETFGEFDSIEELNAAAEGQKVEGDRESFFLLARENGIDEVAAEAYWNGESDEFTDYFSGAIGKLEVEKVKTIKTDSRQMPVGPIVDYLSSECMEETFARVVRNKGKNLDNCIELVAKKVEAECKTSGGYVADMTVFQWAKEYYTGGNGK